MYDSVLFVNFLRFMNVLGGVGRTHKHDRHLFMDHYVSSALGVGYFSELQLSKFDPIANPAIPHSGILKSSETRERKNRREVFLFWPIPPQLANSTPPLSVTGSAIAPSARMLEGWMFYNTTV